jgi:hypothetical protein
LNKHPKDFAKYKIEYESIEGGVEGCIRKSKKNMHIVHPSPITKYLVIKVIRKMAFNSSSLKTSSSML